MTKENTKQQPHVERDGQGLTDTSVDVVVETPIDRAELERNPRLREQMQPSEAEEARLVDVEERRLPDRPSDKAGTPAWVDYCVALGASREDLENETVHNQTGRDISSVVLGQYKSPAYGKTELSDLADRLGG